MKETKNQEKGFSYRDFEEAAVKQLREGKALQGNGWITLQSPGGAD